MSEQIPWFRVLFPFSQDLAPPNSINQTYCAPIFIIDMEESMRPTSAPGADNYKNTSGIYNILVTEVVFMKLGCLLARTIDQ